MSKDEPDFKETIITNARKIFIQYGYKKTTMNDIAKACRKSKGLIYHYYNSKEEIFRLIITREINTFFTLLQENLKKAGGIKTKLKAFFSSNYEFFENNKTVNSLLIKDIFEYIDIIRDQIESFFEELHTILKRIITEAQSNGEIEVDNIDETTATLMSLIKSLDQNPIFSALHLDIKLQQNLDRLVEILLFGLIKR